MQKYEIMLVDDDPIILKSIGPSLESEGYNVTTADNGKEAAEMVTKNDFDLVLTDMAMEPMNGMDVLMATKANNPDTMVIILTGYADVTSAIDAFRLGVDDYLPKPCASEEISFRIKRCLENLEMRKKVKLAEEALQNSEERYRTFTQTATDAVICLNERGAISMWNESAKRMFGYSQKDALGKDLHNLIIPKKYWEDAYKGLKHFFKTGKGKLIGETLEVTALHKNDTEFPIELSISAMQIGDQWLATGIIRDITSRKLAEEALRESEEIHRTVANSVWASIIIIQDEKVMWANNVAFNKMGYSEDEFIGLDFQKIIYSDDLPGVIQRYQDRVSGKSVEDPSYIRIITKDGKILETEKRSAVITWAGEPASVQTLRDITEEKRKEVEKKRLEAQLRQAQKMESIGTLAGGVAHDFNNIIGIIMGNTELIMDDIPEWKSSHFNLKEIQTASKRAKDITSQLLRFSRKTDMERKPIKIDSMVDDVLKFLRATIPAYIEIRRDIKETTDTILADPTQIHQVMMNLCVNASHAMEKNGGILEVGIENVILDEDSTALYPDLTIGNYVRITVSDTGQGIDPEIKDRIFDPYFTTKEFGAGTGMGLSNAHGIVKSSGGSIYVDSKPGNGATFTILFPVVEKEISEEVETVNKLPEGNESILYVDDEDSLVRVAQNRLNRLGYQVETRTSPVEALELFRSKPDQFDLVITDMAMTHMTGDNLIKEIKKIRPDIPTILCTGFSGKIDEEKAKETDISAYIEKPFNKREFAAMVRSVLDKTKEE